MKQIKKNIKNYPTGRLFGLLFLASILLLALSSCSPENNASPTPTAAVRTPTPVEEILPETSGTQVVETATNSPAPEETATPEEDREDLTETESPVIKTEEPLIKTQEPSITTSEEGSHALQRGYEHVYSFYLNENICDCGECVWRSTFIEEFNGDRLDTGRWDTGYKAGDHEAQYYVPDAFTLQDGKLVITAEERQVDDRKYASGIITTQKSFDQQYGRFEARVKVPAGQGLWPAFWMLPTTKNYPLEIDVFEVLGHEPDTAYMTNHWDDESGDHTFESFGFKGPDLSQEFHTFTMIWSEEEIVWFIDGQERARETRGIPHEPMFMLLNLAVGGEWPGYPDDSTPFPSTMEIDYVRVYEWVCLDDLGKEFHRE